LEKRHHEDIACWINRMSINGAIELNEESSKLLHLINYPVFLALIDNSPSSSQILAYLAIQSTTQSQHIIYSYL